jgi:hypothetical protein
VNVLFDTEIRPRFDLSSAPVAMAWELDAAGHSNERGTCKARDRSGRLEAPNKPFTLDNDGSHPNQALDADYRFWCGDALLLI